MKIWDNGTYREATANDLEKLRTTDEREYWQNILYDEAVNNKIRERYTASQEFAILRQRVEKPEEYEAYYAYCEECKAFVKEQISKYA